MPSCWPNSRSALSGRRRKGLLYLAERVTECLWALCEVIGLGLRTKYLTAICGSPKKVVHSLDGRAVSSAGTIFRRVVFLFSIACARSVGGNEVLYHEH